ncbi:MAG: DUF5011 domain-containing protein [Patescibacteria group bacterium]
MKNRVLLTLLVLAVVLLGVGCPNSEPEFSVPRYDAAGNYLGTMALSSLDVVQDPQVVLNPPDNQIILTAKNFALERAYGEFTIWVSKEYPEVELSLQLFGPKKAEEAEKNLSHEQLAALSIFANAIGMGQHFSSWTDFIQVRNGTVTATIPFPELVVRMTVIRLESASATNSDAAFVFSNPLPFDEGEGEEGEGEGEIEGQNEGEGGTEGEIEGETPDNCGGGVATISVTFKPNVALFNLTSPTPATSVIEFDVAGMIGANLAAASYVIGADTLVYGPKDLQPIVNCSAKLLVCDNQNDANQIASIIVIYDKTKVPTPAGGLPSLGQLSGEVKRLTVAYTTSKSITIDKAPGIDDADGIVCGSVSGAIPAGAKVAVRTKINGNWKPFPPFVEVVNGKWCHNIYVATGDNRYSEIEAWLMAADADFPWTDAKADDVPLATTVYKRVPSISITSFPRPGTGDPEIVRVDTIVSDASKYKCVIEALTIVDGHQQWVIQLTSGQPLLSLDAFSQAAGTVSTYRVLKYWAWLVEYPLPGAIPQCTDIGIDCLGETPPSVPGWVAWNWVGLNPAIDTTPPVITLLGDNPAIVDVFTPWVDPGVTITDPDDGDLTANLVVTGAVNTSVLGTYMVHYNVSDASGNPATEVIRTVVVVDRGFPVITLPVSSPQSWDVGVTYVASVATVTDNYDTGLTAQVVVSVDTTKPGSGSVTYTAIDSSGNTTTVILVVNVVDNTPPVIEPIADITMHQWDFQTVQLTATDNIPTGLVWKSVVSSDPLLELDFTQDGLVRLYTHDVAGVATVTVTLADASGLETIAIFQVTVCECQGPLIEVLQSPSYGTWDNLLVKVTCYNPNDLVLFTQVSVPSDLEAILPPKPAGPWWPKDNWGLAGLKVIDPITKEANIQVATGGFDNTANAISVAAVQAVVNGVPLAASDLPPGNDLQQAYIGIEPFQIRGTLNSLFIDKTPKIVPLFVSPYGDPEGRVDFAVTSIDPELFDIVVDVWADGLAEESWGFGWRAKPSFDMPITQIDSSNQGTVDITTGPGDVSATAVSITLRWKTDFFPPLYGQVGIDGSDPSGPFIPGAVVQKLICLDLDGSGTFTGPAYTLTMDVVGQGTVEPGYGDHHYPEVIPAGQFGTNILVRAIPDPGWYLLRWEGATASETDLTSVALVNEPTQTIRAVFAEETP